MTTYNAAKNTAVCNTVLAFDNGEASICTGSFILLIDLYLQQKDALRVIEIV